jgi:hypothetical protein
MIQVQFILDFRENKNTIALNLLEREDANDLERQLAGYIQDLHLSIVEQIREQAPDIELEKIG